MRLVIISGRSGSGKTTALHVLEDMGFYCVDNLPVGLLPELIQQLMTDAKDTLSHIGVGIDARNLHTQLMRFHEVITGIETLNVTVDIIYLDADETTLLKRFSETRRKHPMSSDTHSLSEAIHEEKHRLEVIAEHAHLTIDTSSLTIHQLRDLIKTRINADHSDIALLFQSFGFKNGIPIDADMVFDVRCLPNPHWVTHLRMQTGQDDAVIAFLESHDSVHSMLNDISAFLSNWLPKFEANNRSYLTVAIGCTGGQHRSVYITECLGQRFAEHMPNVQVRHRELLSYS